ADVLGDGTRAAYFRLYSAFKRHDFHCARTVLRGHAGRIPEEKLLLKASSAFLGGTSFAGMTCSALTAGAMALGMGMGEIERSPLRVLRMVFLILTGGPAFGDNVNKFNGAMNRGAELAAWFARQYGSTQCRAITKADFASGADVEAYIEGDGIPRCQRIAESVAERVRIMLGENSAAKVECA
ncbi:MAG: C-GCAxxG-C-C family protein, partial [Spirochaetaceae bacterium]|nr:C-GCAxxG-C-C family protein [Spirochaetaceae bacterium]